jgi:2-succinyl-6-hydroxy-2,4-cyclohexadiene-1-carboxylate synthase
MTELVFVHGFLGSPAMWQGVVDALGRPQGVHLATLPGHGLSANAATLRETSFEQAVDALAAEIPIERAVWIGYSMGARVVLSLAARHPSRVAQAVLVGVHPGLLDEDERRARAERDEAHATSVEKDGLERFIGAWERLPLFASQALLPADVRARRCAERHAHTPRGIAWALRTLGLGRMRPMWNAEHIVAPLLFVTGELDTKFTRVARAFERHALARGGPRVASVVIPSAGHDVALECPEALAKTIQAAITAAAPRSSLHHDTTHEAKHG